MAFTTIVLAFFILKHYFLSIACNLEKFKIQIVISIYILAFLPIVMTILEITGIVSVVNKAFTFCGGFYNPAATANYLVSLAPFSFAILFLKNEKKSFIKIFSYIILISSIILLVLIKARTAWIAFVVSIIYILCSERNIPVFFKEIITRKVFRYIILITCCFFLVYLLFVMYDFKRDSAEGRIFIWKNSLHIVKDNLLFGSGFSTFQRVYNDKQIDYFKCNPGDIKNGMLSNDASYAFNDYIQISVDLGLIGLGLFLCVLYLVFCTKRSNSKNEINTILIGSKACILSIMICSFFSYPIQIIQNYFIFFLFVAIVASVNKTILNITGIISKTINIFILFIVCWITYYHVLKFIACEKWEKAFKYCENNRFSKSAFIYTKIYHILNSTPSFLFNYGTALIRFNECDKSIIMLKKATGYLTTYNLYITMGEAYECENNDSLAEEMYIKAAYLVPHRFIPRYKLFKLYRKLNKSEKALILAKEINDMNIKIYSQDVSIIKKEVLKYLEIIYKK